MDENHILPSDTGTPGLQSVVLVRLRIRPGGREARLCADDDLPSGTVGMERIRLCTALEGDEVS